MPVPAKSGEPEAWLALDLIPGLGSETFRKLLRVFGSPAAILEQNVSTLKNLVPTQLAQAIAEGADSQKHAAACKWLEHENNHLLTLADADYPQQLLEIPDPPPLLYLKGRRELLSLPGIAVVGSRNATPGGEQN